MKPLIKITGVFDFLAEFGRDCAGAITLSHQPGYKASSGPTEIVDIEMKKIHQAIEENLSVAEVISETSPGYLSIAGPQNKFLAVFKDGKFYLPKGGHPTIHGPGLKQNYEFLTLHIPPKFRHRSMERFLDWVCFNLVIGNNDSHSKNVSLHLYENNKYKLAPFHDLISTSWD